MDKIYYQKHFPIKELKCAVCGKIFIPAPSHIFNEIRKGKTYHICGYNCNCEFNRKNPKSKGGRRKKNESELFAENS